MAIRLTSCLLLGTLPASSQQKFNTGSPRLEAMLRDAETAAGLAASGKLLYAADARHWLTIAAEAGDTVAMRRLIEEFDAGDLQRCWMWLYFAKLVGTDLTKSNHFAIHDDGSPYDDDVGGTAHVAGDPGVELPPLDPDHDAMAQKAAQELFIPLQQTG